jgi:dihydropteroate synthase
MSDARMDPEAGETLTRPGAPPFTLMGVINVTPDSFSDGGRFLLPEAAVAQGLRLEAEGAEILDIGGESTRPGAATVSADEEMARVLPVIQGLVDCGTTARLSVDTSKARVARAALEAGATMVNDVTALRDPDMAAVVAETGAHCCLMHMPGDPRTMQIDPHYDDVVTDVRAYLAARLEFALSRGIPAERILIDPGIGFGKTVEHNLELLARLHELVELGRPVLIGTSRKSFLGKLTGRDVEDRLPGTIASCLVAYEHGASVFRVHDVAPVHDALLVAAATVRRRWPTTNSAKATR